MTTPKSSKKRSSDEHDFDVMRRYLLSCPLVDIPEENAAVRAALRGLEEEVRRRERDERLQKKFSKGNYASSVSTAAGPPKAVQSVGEDLDDGWQNVSDEEESVNRGLSDSSEVDEVEIIDMDRDTSFLGTAIAELAIASIAESRVKAKTPLAAIALALHAAMRSQKLGFTCTGCVDDDKPSTNGFAKPIRDLPKNQFLPREWDCYASPIDTTEQKVVLRYRKNGIGSVRLKVEQFKSKEVSVKVVLASTKEPPSESLTFPLEDHINVDSMTLAQRSTSCLGVEPALHYKKLSSLMTAFVNNIDLGSIDESNDREPAACIGFQTSVIHTGISVQALGDSRTPTIDFSFPRRPMFVGDFSGDLAPEGAPALNPFRRVVPDSYGSILAPNHPMFGPADAANMSANRSGFGLRSFLPPDPQIFFSNDLEHMQP